MSLRRTGPFSKTRPKKKKQGLRVGVSSPDGSLHITHHGLSLVTFTVVSDKDTIYTVFFIFFAV